MTARTQEEILARFKAVTDTDWLGHRREVLAAALERMSVGEICEPDGCPSGGCGR